MTLRGWLQPWDSHNLELGLWVTLWRDDLTPSWNLKLKVALIAFNVGLELDRWKSARG